MKLRKSLYCCGALILFSSIGFTTNTINAASKAHHSHITRTMRHPKRRTKLHKHMNHKTNPKHRHSSRSKNSAYYRGFQNGKGVGIEEKINAPFTHEQHEDEEGNSPVPQIPYYHLWHAVNVLPKASRSYSRGWYKGFQSINKPFMKTEKIQDIKEGLPKNEIPNSLLGYKTTKSHTIGGNPIIAVKRASKFYKSHKNPMIRQGLKASIIGGGFSYGFGKHADRYSHIKHYAYTANGYKRSLTLCHNKTFRKGLQIGWDTFDQGMFG